MELDQLRLRQIRTGRTSHSAIVVFESDEFPSGARIGLRRMGNDVCPSLRIGSKSIAGGNTALYSRIRLVANNSVIVWHTVT